MPAEPRDHAVRLWAMAIGDLEEKDVSGWRAVLDYAERARVERLAVARNRVEYIAAHALTRRVLSEATGEAPSAFRYQVGAKGKPVAVVYGRPAAIEFNLSHTNGLVAIAVSRLGPVGVDAEAIDRNVNLAVADRYFFGAEGSWLAGLPPAGRAEGFLRLWTLKEAYIKATGRGLSQPLDEFWFEIDPPRIRFTPAIADDEGAWRFDQRVLAGRFLVAVGWRAGCGDGGDDGLPEVALLEPEDLSF